MLSYKKNFLPNNKIVIILLVRLNSKRFPQKAKKKINGIPIIELLIKRLIRKFPKKVIYICTSSFEKDNFLKKISLKYQVNFHSGSDMNIFKRIISLYKKKKFKHFVRVTGDNPFTDVEAINKMSTIHIKDKADYTYTDDLPVGTRPEIISIEALYKANNLAVDKNSSEYMTYFFKRDIFKRRLVKFKKILHNQNLFNVSIDTFNQFKFIEKLIEKKNIYINRNKLILLLKKSKKLLLNKKTKVTRLQTKKYNVKFKNNLSDKILN